MKTFILSIIVFLCATVSTYGQRLSLDEILQASCRVSSYGQSSMFNGTSIDYGSGVVVSEDENQYFILTNGHVIKNARNTVYVEFFHNGHKSSPVKTTVKWVRFVRNSSIDAALLSVSKQYFGKIKPVVIPLGDKGITLKNGNYVYGAGCPRGYWNQAWEARVIRNTQNITYINAPPAEGQSGSALLADLLDDKGDVNTRIVGLITWRIGSSSNSSEGGTVSLNRLHEIFTGIPKTDSISTSFSYPSNYSQDQICGACGKKLSDHMVVPDGNGGLIRDSKNQIRLFCPKSSVVQNKGIKTGTFLCNGCPPGGCFHFPWLQPSPPNRINYPPAQPAPISPDGIWNIPDADIKKSEEAPPPPPPEEKPDKEKELQDKITDLLSQLTDSKNNNKTLEQSIIDITKKLTDSEKSNGLFSKDIQDKLKIIENLTDSLDNSTTENKSLLSTIAKLNSDLGISEKLLGDKDGQYADLLNRFTETSTNNEQLAKENTELSYNNNFQNVSLTLAGAGTTAGIWFLKSYLLPAVIGGFRRRKTNKGGGANAESQDINYGSVPEAVLNNPNDKSTDQRVVDKGYQPEYMMPKSELPNPQFVDEMYKGLQGQLPEWNNYAAYGQQYSPMVRGLNPGAPYGTPFMKKQPTPDQIMTALSEISNEYANDYTMTASHTLTLLKQRLKTKYGIDY